MKNTLLLSSLLIVAFAARDASAAPSKMQVSLSISPEATLPGLSVPLTLRIKNGARAVHVRPGIRVRLTSPTGESFFARWEHYDFGELEFGITDEEDKRFILPANATVELSVPAIDLSQPTWALDGRLLALPGEWTLRVYLYGMDPAGEDPDDRPLEPAISNPVKLTIETPSGRDVDVWQALQRGELWAIARKVYTERPESRYFPYLSTLVTQNSTLDKIAIIGRAIELHPSSPVVPRLHYTLAYYYDLESGWAWGMENDFDKAVALAEKGRAVLAKLKDSKDPWSRLTATRKLCCEYSSREKYEDLRRLRREKGGRKP